MAQMAALGICLAVLLHIELESWTTFGIALAFTLAGAGIFSVTGKRTSQIPQEAVIGISYVVAAAAAVLLLSRAAEGDEEIKNMLVGNILLVTPREVWERSRYSWLSVFSILSSVEVFFSCRLIVTAPIGKDSECAGGIFSSTPFLVWW
jgi:ABC-type Mn2+/Zn2+ transport system permease subunit